MSLGSVFARWRTRESSRVIQLQSEGLRTREAKVACLNPSSKVENEGGEVTV